MCWWLRNDTASGIWVSCPERGAKVEMVEGVVYTDLLDAERDIFKRRWKELTGQDVESLLAQSSSEKVQ